MEKYQTTLLAVILACGLVFAAKIVTVPFTGETISTTGSASEIVQSDSAKLEIQIVTKAPTKALAYTQVKKQLPVVLKYLKDQGLINIEIGPHHGYETYKMFSGRTTNEVDFFNMYCPITIKSDDVYKVANVVSNIQSLLEQGIEINVNSTEYYYSKLADIKIKLLQDATVDARERAQAMLKPTNTRLGKVKSMTMGVFQITPVDSTEVSSMGINDTTTIDKKVTAVARVSFRLQ